MIRGRVLALVLALCLPSLAQAQYAPNRLDVVERVDRSCPGLIRQDHAFTDAVATVLNAEDARWGRNGKRGNPNDPSHDALFYRTSASPFGGAVIDMIVGAGGPNPAPAWIDQTDATIAAHTTGVWVAPSGRLPGCLTGGGSTPPPVTPPPVVTPPAPSVDLGPLLAALQRIDQRLAAIEARPVPDFLDAALLNAYIDDMVGKGPAGDPQLMPNHVTDLKERLDVIRVDLERVTAWLKSRTILRR